MTTVNSCSAPDARGREGGREEGREEGREGKEGGREGGREVGREGERGGEGGREGERGLERRCRYMYYVLHTHRTAQCMRKSCTNYKSHNVRIVHTLR